MNERPELTQEQLELLIELVEREERELPTEIHHTRLANYRDALHHRLDVVRGALERLRTACPV